MLDNNLSSSAKKGFIVYLAMVAPYFVITFMMAMNSEIKGIREKPFDSFPFLLAIIALTFSPIVGMIAFKIKRCRRFSLNLVGALAFVITMYIFFLFVESSSKPIEEPTFGDYIIILPMLAAVPYIYVSPFLIIAMLILEKWTRPMKLSFKRKRDEDKWFIWPQKC